MSQDSICGGEVGSPDSLALDTISYQAGDGTIGSHPGGLDGIEISTQGSR